MRPRLAVLLLLFAVVSDPRGAEPPQAPEGGDTVAPPAEAAPASTPAPDAGANLDPAERDVLLRVAWRTLTGHLTGRPIVDADLEPYQFTPRLFAPRGCWVTVRRDGVVRGSQGEIEPTRPLYQQAIVFTRRAATRDPRFIPLTAVDLPKITLEIALIGRRETITSPAEIRLDRHGVFLEKWGRRAVFLPGIAAAQGWTAERTLEELCRQASLPDGAWASARLEVFTAEIVEGAEPPPLPAPTAAPAPTDPGQGTGP